MKSVANALNIFEEISRRQPVNLTALADRTGLPYANVHRAVATLHRNGWVRPSPEVAKSWVVSSRVEALFTRTSSHVVEVARPFLIALRDETGESVSFFVLDGNDVEIVFHIDGTRSLRVVHVVGVRAPAHASAVGKALISLLPPATRTSIARGGLRTYTPNTITEPDEFLTELEIVASRGYAVMHGEWDPLVSSVGAAVIDSRGAAFGGVGISWPAERYDEEEIMRLAGCACECAARITRRLTEIDTDDGARAPYLDTVIDERIERDNVGGRQ